MATRPAAPSSAAMTATLYALVVLIWGSTWIALKLQLGGVPVELSIAYRFALAAALMFAWLAWSRQLRVPRGPVLPRVLAQGLCLFSLNFVCFMHASETLASGLAAVVFSSANLWNALLARVLHGRRLAPHVLAGSALGLAGLVVLFWPELRDGRHASVAGLAWAVLGTLCFSCGNMLSASLQSMGWRPAQTNAWGMLAGTLLLVIYALVAGLPWRLDMEWTYLGSLLYLAVPGSVIAFTAYLTLVGRLGPEKAAYATVLFPIVALAISALFEGYAWTPQAVLGMGLAMLGNLLVFRPPRWLLAMAPQKA
ncbi:MAG: DMT family transporter [Burkholderiaceae bacterium]|nr:DMT family transporter [Burkholderiaceae bacterium]